MLCYSKMADKRKNQIAENIKSRQSVRKPIQLGNDRSVFDDYQLQRNIGNQGILHLLSMKGTLNTEVQSPAKQQTAPIRIMRLPAEPYVKQINVNLDTPQSVAVDWQGTPPEDVRSTFRCSTGKGYGDPDDPPGICNRACCTPGVNPCESPYDQRRSRGSCCTPIGDFVIQNKDREHAVEGGTIPFWMYFYRRRGIALHEYSPVDGTPLSHGCVRLDSVNAEMLFNYSHENVTRVSVAGTATPACPAGNGVACTTSGAVELPESLKGRGELAAVEQDEIDRSV